jgi:hypothetical protein
MTSHKDSHEDDVSGVFVPLQDASETLIRIKPAKSDLRWRISWAVSIIDRLLSLPRNAIRRGITNVGNSEQAEGTGFTAGLATVTGWVESINEILRPYADLIGLLTTMSETLSMAVSMVFETLARLWKYFRPEGPVSGPDVFVF